MQGRNNKETTARELFGSMEPNFMTPDPFDWVDLDGRRVELSHGMGLFGGPVVGVSVYDWNEESGEWERNDSASRAFPTPMVRGNWPRWVIADGSSYAESLDARQEEARGYVDAMRLDVGCYVDGWWGQYAPDHMVGQFSALDPVVSLDDGEREVLEWMRDRESNLMSAADEPFDGAWEVRQDIADKYEESLNELLPADMVAHWFDGVFRIDRYECGGDGCDSDTCACSLFVW